MIERTSVRDKQEPPLQDNCSDTLSVPVALTETINVNMNDITSNGGASLTITQTTKCPADDDNHKSTVTSDVSSPTETADDDAHPSDSDMKMVVVENPSQTSENTYAQIDKTRKDLKRREVSRYEQVLGFGPKIGLVENLTGSDTFMFENDLYAKVTLEPPTSQIPEIVNETIHGHINYISDKKTENNCECMDSNGSPKGKMKEELKENTHTQLEKT